MKNVFKLMLGAAVVVLASCGGETAAAGLSAEDSLRIADSTAKATAAADSAANAAANATTAPSDSVADSTK